MSALIGGAIAYKLLPAKIEVKTEIKEHEVTQNHIVTVTHEVTKPDGTKEIITTTTDNSVEHKDKQIEIQKSSPKDWFLTAGVARESLTSDNIYQISVNRRILGPLYIGGSFNTEKQLGLNLGMEF